MNLNQELEKETTRLKNMLDDNHISKSQYDNAIIADLPTESFLDKRMSTLGSLPKSKKIF